MTTTSEKEPAPLTLISWGRVQLDLEQAVYGTVVVMTVLVVALANGVDSFSTAAQVIAGPLIATFVARLFASTLASVNSHGALPGRAEFGHLAEHAAQYLMIALGPLLVLTVEALSGLTTAEDAVVHLLYLGLLLLVGIGGVGGWRAGKRWWWAVLGAIAAAALGVVVLVLRLVLEH